MTDWNYFLVNIYLSFNFLINPVCSRKEGRSATVFLMLLCKQQNFWELFHGNKVLNISLHHQHQSKLLAFSLVAETILSFWSKHLHKEYRALCFCPLHGSCCLNPGPALAKCTSGTQKSPGIAGVSVVAEAPKGGLGWEGAPLHSEWEIERCARCQGVQGSPIPAPQTRTPSDLSNLVPTHHSSCGVMAWSCSVLCLHVAHSETEVTSVFLKKVKIASVVSHSE